jgi:membrane protein required for colicin V production
MNTPDIIISVFLFLFALYGFWKGFLAGLLHLAGLIVAILLISKIGYVVKYGMMELLQIGELPAGLIAYVLIFIIIMIITKIVIWAIKRLLAALSLSFIDRILGAAFGFVNGLLVVGMILILADLSPFAEEVNQLTNESRIVQTAKLVSAKVAELVPFLKTEVDKNI